MELEGYSDPTFSQDKKTSYSCTVQVNPESYSLDQGVTLNAKQAQGSTGAADNFGYLNPRKLSFEIIFDATGALATTAVGGALGKLQQSKYGILPQFERFKDTVCKYVGEGHRTPFVQLTWGQLIFRCQLESLSASFKLFSPEGVPLRASVKVAFQEVIEDTKLMLLAAPKSADLTHLRTVQAGDTLPLLCQQIYGNPALYPQVARANGLSNLRTLRVGQQLSFPPLVPATNR